MIATLPASDRFLLHLAVRAVPSEHRSDWLRYWQAELWHCRHARPHKLRSATVLYPGLLGDALWLRAETHRRALSGTARQCLLLLAGLVLLALVPLYAFLGNTPALLAYLAANTSRFLSEAVLVSLVGFLTAARSAEHTVRFAPASKLRSFLFHATKITLVLMLAFNFSSDLTLPLHTIHPFTADILQPETFVLLALFALRWNFSDSDARCKNCLRTLATPTRVGRPSRNFLDSNGTELACPVGHGHLSVPELETSWRQSSRWIVS